MKILVAGATGGSGRAAVAELLRRGHTVTALSRHANTLTGMVGDLRTLPGDATSPADAAAAVAGQDAVVITLGISENPLRVRTRGPAGTPLTVRSQGTATLIEAMATHGVRRLVVQSSYGVGETRDNLGPINRLIFAALLKPQIADHERQEHHVRASGLDWALVQPVHLTDGTGTATATLDGAIRSARVSRAAVATVLADAVENDTYLRRTVSVSS